MDNVRYLILDGKLGMKLSKTFLVVILGAAAGLLVLQVALDGWASDSTLYRIVTRENYPDDETTTHIYAASLQVAPVTSSIHLQKISTISTASSTASRATSSTADVSSAPIAAPAPLPLQQQTANSTKVKSELPKRGEKIPVVRSRPILKPEQLLKIVGNLIASFPPVPSHDVVRVLVVTYFRAGSTFIGDILQQNWKTFYHFEPLHYMSNGVRIKESDVPEALNLLENIFRCRFSEPIARKYIQWVSQERNTFLFKRNHFLWVACRVQPQTCFREDFLAYVCNRAPVQVMKVTRMNMAHVQRFVENNRDLDLRVVHLVRDPRGTISSRKVRDWCNTTSCSDFRVLCGEMEEDARVFDNLRKSNPKRYFQLRYEDLSVSPEKVARQLYSVLGIPFTTSVRRFLKISTRAREVDERDPYSTRRNSSQAPFAWKQKLKAADVARIQIGCARTLRRYHYDIFTSRALTTTMATNVSDGH